MPKAKTKYVGGKKYVWIKGSSGRKGHWRHVKKTAKKKRSTPKRRVTKRRVTRRRNPTTKRKTVKKALKITHTYKRKPKWHKSGMGEYVILTRGGRVHKSFGSLSAAKAYSTKLRSGYRLVKVPKSVRSSTARKKNPNSKRRVTRRPRRRTTRRRRRF